MPRSLPALLAGLLLAAPMTQARAADPAFESRVPGLAITPLASLPPAPASARERQGCETRLMRNPRSEAARQVAAAGWGVTGEEKLGRYQAVSFAGEFQGGTSGSCQVGQGNVAVFEGSRLLAVAYAERGAPRSIGGIAPLWPDGLRLWDGDFLAAPLADLRPAGGAGGQGGAGGAGGGQAGQPGAPERLALLPLAAEEQVCQGRGRVPNIYGQPIDRARAALLAAGWQPVPGERDPALPEAREKALLQHGVTEVESCSGTGFGFCSYRYRGPAGQLSVTSVGDGELPSVSDYAVRCGAGG